MSGLVHLAPDDDAIDHTLADVAGACPCGPKVEVLIDTATGKRTAVAVHHPLQQEAGP